MPRPGGRPPGRRHLVALLAFDAVQLLDVTGPAEVFTTANAHGARYDLRIVSATGADIVTSAGVRVGVDARVDELPARLGTLVVPGRPDWRAAVADRELIGRVTSLSARSDRTASVCAGAFLLAEAGLLDGRRAATHWQLAAELAGRYPRVSVEPDPVFVRDGTLFTSAGVTAGIDLALALVEEDHGPDLARAVARQLVVFMARPAGQSQFSARLAPREARHPVLRQVMDAVGADPATAGSVDLLARQAGISPRHLSRLFRTETGMTPGQYVESVRLEAAQVLLEAGNEPVDTVAERSGFGSAESMRRTFQQTLGIPPTVYRARFRSTAAPLP
ncbi:MULTISPECIES: helix-turn-helix domain-containing protein [unclassified Streptomyces]|uniref:helix-turn-helix domain-containing protein n=1 Tax=unclassified Streptomyces TaxID=2593676 RepID=UPI000B839864|nr:helix-turn-helix domain-containing protein [Streptomyces sp. SID4948]